MSIRHQFDDYVFFGFFISIVCAEIFVKVRFRLALQCRTCGFDPVVYIKNPQLACNDVKKVLERRKSDPTMILKKPLFLPKITKDRHDFWVGIESQKKSNLPAEIQTGRLLAKQI